MINKFIKIKKQFVFLLIVVLLVQLAPMSIFYGNLNVSAAEQEVNTEISELAVVNENWKGYDSLDELVATGVKVNQDIVAEGTVLLKNEGTLPLNKSTEVAFLGRNTRYMVTNGGGAAAPKSMGEKSNANLALDDEYANLGGKINDAAHTYFHGDTFKEKGDLSNMMDYSREMDFDNIPSTVSDTYDASGVAVLTISRFGCEMKDLRRTEKKSLGTDSHAVLGEYRIGGALNDGDHNLMLSPAELKMIDYANKHFDKVILLINSANPVELGFLDDEIEYEESRSLSKDTYDLNVDAALWVGFPGYTGTTSIAKILCGEVNPSGRLTDILPRDFTQDPVWQNKGLGTHEGGDVRSDIGYVHYEEDIYYGYKYWETRGYEEKKADNASTWYEDHVVYPFGYGLSYTDFSYELVGQSVAEGSSFERETEFSFDVKVTNNGDVAGKETVQIYYTAPYDKKTAPIEKSQVNLVAFGKTDIIEPGASDTITISFTADDMKSYDWQDINNNGIKGYELEAGEYSVKIAKNSHEYPIEVKYNLEESIYCEKDLTTGTKVENLFDEISTSEYGCKTYMSRADFEGTYPIEGDEPSQSNSEVIYLCTEEDDKKYDFYVEPENMPYYAQEAGDSLTNNIKLYHMYGRDYDDPLWDKLLDQLTLEEMAKIVGEGSYRSNNLDSISKPYTYESDGPTGWVSEEAYTLVCFASTCVLASTFNKDLATAYGQHLAKEGNTPRDGKNGTTVNFTGLYAPGVNLHRTQFCGRNFEYFSEDAVLTGYMAAAQVKAMREGGIAAYVKHFVLNEQETNRYYVNTWASEQNMRENACKAFEIVVKEGNPLAMMNAYNNVGNYQSGMLYNLNIRLLRDEWGFEGSLISDWGSHTKMKGGVNAIIRGGIDHIMNNNNGALHVPSLKDTEITATLVTAIRRGAKNVLYKVANTSAVNLVDIGPQLSGYYNGGEIVAVSGKSLSVNIANAVGYNGLECDFAYALSSDTTLPAGLSLSANGMITGTVTAPAGSYTFKVKATEAGDVAAASAYSVPEVTFTITVKDASTSNGIILPDFSAAKEIAAGAYYSSSIYAVNLTDSGASDALTYELVGGKLPEGMELVGNTISGTPVNSDGQYQAKVKITAANGASEEMTVTYNVDSKEMTFEPTEIPDMTVGTHVNIDINTAQGVDCELTGVNYRLKPGSVLPDGLTLAPNGVISGTPTKGYNDHSFVIVAGSNEAKPVEATFTVNVKGIVVNDLEQTLYLNKNVFIDLAQTVSCNNGTENPSYLFELAEGSEMPDGLVLFADGKIYGKVNELKNSNITVAVSTRGNQSVKMNISFIVEEIYYESGDIEYGEIDDAVEPKSEQPVITEDGEGINVMIPVLIVSGCVVAVAVVVCIIFIAKKKSSKAN